MTDHAQIDRDGTARDQGSNQSGMRDRNERLVLTILRRQGALPKAEIARRTGLSAQTVSVIMRALEADGLLSKGEKLRGRVGQPSVPMELAPEGALFFGLKVGRRSADLLLVDFVGRILDRRHLTYRYPTPAQTLDFARDTVAELMATLSPAQQGRIAGLGIASPYFLWEWGNAIGVDESEMSAWRGFDLEAEVGRLFDFPVHLGNDATCACGAELVFGTGPRPRDFLHIYLGYFVGGGVVLNDKLYVGASGNAGAIGPMPIITADGTPSHLMEVASLIRLEQRLLAAGGDAAQMWNNPEAWNFDQAVVDAWLDEAIPAIANAVLAAISIIDFPAIVIDGSLPGEIRTRIVEGVAAHLGRLDPSGLILPEILPGTQGHAARGLGAASLPLSKRFMLET
ncbi:MAG: ROK family transcriptional regulator [Silicimonas sp.]|nr:ROK family transcriptional regulator [Silicimonas sp.]